jgi:hypothetical protein
VDVDWAKLSRGHVNGSTEDSFFKKSPESTDFGSSSVLTCGIKPNLRISKLLNMFEGLFQCTFIFPNMHIPATSSIPCKDEYDNLLPCRILKKEHPAYYAYHVQTGCGLVKFFNGP